MEWWKSEEERCRYEEEQWKSEETIFEEPNNEIVGSEEKDSVRIEQSNSTVTSLKDDDDDVEADTDDDVLLQWAAVGRQPTFERLKLSLFDENNEDGRKKKKVIDVTKLGGPERHMFIEKLIKHIENDNLRLLQKQRKRLDKVGVKLPTLEVRYNNLCVEAECEIVHGKPLPTLLNSLQSFLSGIARIAGFKSKLAQLKILDDISGIIKPGRLTLLLGPPGCGKTTLLKALSGNLDPSLKVKGKVSYNGYEFKEFVVPKTSAYISQYNLHFPEMTVRETLDFSACCQGVGSRAEIMIDVCRKEKEIGIVPDPDVDTFMKAISVEGQKTTLQTDYILKILGLDICADTLYGDAMRRGISGGQKKRLTTGAMTVGPTKALFMDEISNGLDSSTTYQIISCLQQLAHITDATVLVSLLQPAPETFDLFDDIMLMAEGKIIYHGARNHVLDFFESCGFRCPERKGVADFLQEVISRKDQAKFWHQTERPYSYISVDVISKRFKNSPFWKNVDEDLSGSFLKSQTDEKAISFSMYSLSNWMLLRACMSREFLLMRRNSFVYIFKSVQIVILAFIAMTVFIRTRMDIDLVHANYYMGALYYSLVVMMLDAIPELSITAQRLPAFYEQRDMYLYPAWAYAIPAALIKVPMSLLVALIWTSLTYYVIGYSPEAGRFFGQLLLIFAWHFTQLSLFRMVASVFRTPAASSAAGGFVIILFLLLGGFLIPHSSMPSWLKWGFWCSPLSYGQIGLSVNEFLAPRWTKLNQPTNTSIGKATLESRGLDLEEYYYWISIGALFGFIIICNIGYTLALTYLKAPSFHAIITKEKLAQIQGNDVLKNNNNTEKSRNTCRDQSMEKYEGNLVLPFEPLTLVFQEVQYHVDATLEMRKRVGFTQKRVQLLSDVTGTFRPGVLTALMGVSGAGKTTLFDVLAGRKSSGIVEGEITIGGYPKVQDTFARISGYCEQTDIHSPQITVEESVIFSAWLRLHPDIDSKTKTEFIKQVLAIIELDDIKDELVGMPGVSGLSTEQRKRLTIAVELVANPSILFLDEPTTGLDARSAAIVMRAVKNIVRTGRTTVCTIHQPSIDIFEAFDELVLLKTGGQMIYCGPLGQNSCEVINYFQGISGVSKIKSNYNPATWMLDVTSASSEAELGVDFAQIYQNSTPCQNNKDLAKRLSLPPSGSKQLKFPTRFPQNGWVQFKSCLWKQNLSYWRSPSYILVRCVHIFISSLLFGALYWDQGRKINNQQSLFTISGVMYAALLFCGVNNANSAMPYVTTERTVHYRERFSGMYSSWAYALAQVIVEVPYIFVQTFVFVILTYPMIGYYWTAYKVFWYFFAMFCTLSYYSYLGMLLVSVTPSLPVAAILASAFYTFFNLFSGFLVPQKQIPKWWIWLYYLTPTSWTFKGMLTSQYGDVTKEIVAFGETKTVAQFMRDYYGFDQDQLPLVAAVLVFYPIFFASLFAYCIGKLNFQSR